MFGIVSRLSGGRRIDWYICVWVCNSSICANATRVMEFVNFCKNTTGGHKCGAAMTSVGLGQLAKYVRSIDQSMFVVGRKITSKSSTSFHPMGVCWETMRIFLANGASSDMISSTNPGGYSGFACVSRYHNTVVPRVLISKLSSVIVCFSGCWDCVNILCYVFY